MNKDFSEITKAKHDVISDMMDIFHTTLCENDDIDVSDNFKEKFMEAVKDLYARYCDED